MYSGQELPSLLILAFNSPVNLPVNSQKVAVRKELQVKVLQFDHYSRLVGRSGMSPLVSTTCWDLYCRSSSVENEKAFATAPNGSHMAYMTVVIQDASISLQENHYCNTSLDILEPLKLTGRRNKYLLIMTRRSSLMKHAMHLSVASLLYGACSSGNKSGLYLELQNFSQVEAGNLLSTFHQVGSIVGTR